MMKPKLTIFIWIALWTIKITQVVGQENVKIPAEDGLELGARFYKSTSAAPAVLLMHQCDRQGDSTGLEPLVKELIAFGLNVLELDLRGFGKSRNNTFTQFRTQMRITTPHFPSDIEAVYQFLIKQPTVDKNRIATVGASCSATQSIYLAQNHPEIKAMAFLSGSFWPGAAEAFEKVTDRPLLVITSEEDGVAARMKQSFEMSESPESTLLVYKGNRHGSPLLKQDRKLAVFISNWLKRVIEL